MKAAQPGKQIPRGAPAGRLGQLNRTRSLWTFLSLVGLAAAWPLLAGGADLERFELERSGNRYHLSIDARVAAPLHAVWGVVTDYAHLTRLSPAIREGQILAAVDHTGVRVRTVTRLCALIFCKDVRQLQWIHHQGEGSFEAITEPLESDLAFGQARWHLMPAGQGTRIHIQFDLEPAFWIPPLVGPPVIKLALRQETWGLIQGIEQAARDHGQH